MRRMLSSIALTFSVSSVNAALIDRGNGLIYDTDLNLTWMQDANLAATNTFGVPGIGLHSSGSLSWEIANDWIDAMNANSYIGFSNWRLPETILPDPSCEQSSGIPGDGMNCSESEMSHLFYYELSGLATYSISSNHNENYYLFTNLQDGVYWSSTMYSETEVYAMNFWNGDQGVTATNVGPGNLRYALAVHDGDIGAYVVPLPTAFWLFASGTLSLVGLCRRKQVFL